MNTLLPSKPGECSAAALSRRLLERSLKFVEIAELSEKCGLGDLEKRASNGRNHPITFVVPAFQLVASISRYVE